MALNFWEYEKIAENGREFLRNDLWDITLIRPPNGVYTPPNMIMNIRITDVNTGIDTTINKIEADIRNYNIQQATTVKTNGELTFTIMDREDMTMGHWIEDWSQAIVDRDTMTSGRKEDTSCDWLIRHYNTNRVIIKELLFLDCQPTTNDQGEATYASGTGDNMGELQLAFFYQHYKRLRLSAPIV